METASNPQWDSYHLYTVAGDDENLEAGGGGWEIVMVIYTRLTHTLVAFRVCRKCLEILRNERLRYDLEIPVNMRS